ncbi:MAG: hypothetical protein HYX67_12750 [Candidatus Melainabacteria bacterium]|nr:hypothetical protein [Candidatus Melainabacteria bacterium]
MTEMLKTEVIGTVNNVLSQAENSLLDEGRKEAFSAKGKVSVSADGSKFAGTVDGKSQQFGTSVTSQLGMNWDLSTYDKSHSIYSQGDVKQMDSQLNTFAVQPIVGAATGGSDRIPSTYSSSITNANGDVRNYYGECVTYPTTLSPKVCNTTVKDSDGKLLYTMNEIQSGQTGTENYVAEMSNPNGKKLGLVRARLQGSSSDANLDVTATKF